MASVSNFLFQDQLHQFLGRRGHIFETLTEGNHGKAHALQVLNHLDGTPTVEGNLPNVELLAQVFNKLFDVTVVNDITLSGLKEALAFPGVVRYMIPADAKVKVVLWNPEIRQHRIFVVLVFRGKHQDKSGDIRGGGNAPDPRSFDEVRQTEDQRQEQHPERF